MLARLQSLRHLIVLGVLSADGDLAAIGFLAILVENEDPLAARHTVERALGDDDGLLRLSELQIHIIGLARADVVRAHALEDEVDAELAVPHLGIDLAHLQGVTLAILVEGGSESGLHAVDVVLIHLCLYLIVAQVVHHTYLLSCRHALSQFHIQQTHLAGDGAADIELLFTLAHQLHIFLHRRKVICHLLHLRAAQLGILLQSLVHQGVLLHGEVVVFLCLEIFLLGIELFLVQSLLVLVGAALGHHVLREGEFLVAVGELVLLHGNLCVAEHILFLRQFALGIQDFQVEVGVAELDDDVTLVDVRTLIHHLLQHDAAFLRTDLHHGDRSHLSIHRHIVVELSLLHVADAQRLPIHPQRGGEIAHAEPYEEGDHHRPSCYPCPVLARHEILFLFYLYVHSLIE